MIVAKPKKDFIAVYVDSPNAFNETFATLRCSFIEDPAEETGMSSNYFDLPPYVLDPFVKNPIIKVYRVPEWEKDDVTGLWYNRKIYMENGNFFEYKSETQTKTVSYELYIMEAYNSNTAESYDLYVMEETNNLQKNIFLHIPAEYHDMNKDNIYYHKASTTEMDNKSFLSEGHGIEYVKYTHPLTTYIGVSYGASVLTGKPISIIYRNDNGVNMLNFEYLTHEFQGQIDLFIHAFEEDYILLQNIHNNQLFTMKVKYLEWENKQ